MKEIKLTLGKVALVDDEDYERVKQFKWCAKINRHTQYYAYASGGLFKMHRLILGLTDPKILVDHKDGNGLNNCRSNLRIATVAENNRNRRSKINSTSKYLGVSFKKSNSNWVAQIKSNGIVRHIGSYKSQEEAAFAYNKKAIEQHGEFANLNVIDL